MSITATRHLAKRVGKELLDRDLTHDDVKDAGGPSSPTLTKMLRGDGSSISGATARRLEKVFNWPRGTVAAIADGKEPKWGTPHNLHVVRAIREQFNPALAEFTDDALLAEVEARMVHMAARLHSHGDDSLTFVTDPAAPDGAIVTSRPTRPRG